MLGLELREKIVVEMERMDELCGWKCIIPNKWYASLSVKSPKHDTEVPMSIRHL